MMITWSVVIKIVILLSVLTVLEQMTHLTVQHYLDMFTVKMTMMLQLTMTTLLLLMMMTLLLLTMMR